jgi:DNA-binding CsgD family transcriptional regulator
MGVVEELLRAREAYDRRDWLAAYDGLADADTGTLTVDDFTRLATAAYLLGHRNDCIQAMQRAFAVSHDAGDVLGAVRCAGWLALVLITGGEVAIGSGWTSRARRLLDEVPGDVPERGFLALQLMFQHVHAGELDQAVEQATELVRCGRTFGEADLLAMGLASLGRLRMHQGRVAEGLALMDEAMVGVATGEVSPIFAGDVYCTMIEGCQEISDFGRAGEWTAMLTRWCEEQPGLVPFTGQCAVHRGQIMRMHGAFTEALEEFERALERYLLAGSTPAAGLAWAERGEVLRIRGRLDEAEAAFTSAIGYGHDPQPGLALLWLARGRSEAAVTAVRRLLTESPDPVQRSQLLPAAVEILLATGNSADAAAAAEELTAIAEGFGCTALDAAATSGRGRVALATGEHAAAVPLLRHAARQWSALGARYEVARCRLLLGTAFRRLGDEETAVGELTAARGAFDELGAAPALRETTTMLLPYRPDGLTARELEVLRLVATGRSNPQIAAELVLSEKTVARHLSNIFAKIDVGSRTAATAYAYEHQLV